MNNPNNPIIHKTVSKDDRKLSKDKKKADKKAKLLNKTVNFSSTNFEKKIGPKKLESSNFEIEKTPIGSKKDVSRPLPTSYSPSYTEEGWQSWWENRGFFQPESGPDSGESWAMVIPPPNVTGVLHIGHGLTVAIEDCKARWQRMRGRRVLWLPGADHAGIATQSVVERRVWRERGQTRHDLGRDAFVEEVWRWKRDKADCIIHQLKQLGASCDYSRWRFTMDESMSRAVTEAFVRLFDERLIYRARRLVNWSCCLRSAISDIEVEKVEIPGRTARVVPGYESPVEFGYLVHFSYRVVGTDERVVVATTRIETMLGDSGVAVHPDDERYRHLHGKSVEHPFCAGRTMPIVCDSFVDRNFGTGAVKLTPAHDHNDYTMGEKHRLEFINIFTDDGRIVDGFGEFSGLKRFDARPVIVDRLKERGLFVGITDNPMVIPVCSKSKDIIEPIIKNQWYVSCQEMAREALRVVEAGELKILPEGVHQTVWTRWMEDCRDWCISRQLWWGHRVPAYRVVTAASSGNDEDDQNADWIVARSMEEARRVAEQRFPDIPADQLRLEQDPDVLDTWFSSGLFPFSTLGWPDQTEDLKRFYPTQLLETGHDIVFFWVARMVMLGLKLTGRLPFHTVYLHAMIRDAHGKKMSKSLGNVLNPHDVIHGISLPDLQRSLEHGNLEPAELARAKASQAKDFPNGIPECGTDALRFALLAYTSQPRDINLDVLRVNGWRNFCNKIWQAFRFAQMFPKDGTPSPLDRDLLSPTDHWILSRLAAAVHDTNDALEQYNFSGATTAIHRFMLYELCDVYIEYCKFIKFHRPARQSIVLSVLFECIDCGLRLLHPMMPFITEELYQRLPTASSVDSHSARPESIVVADYPCPTKYNQYRSIDIEKEMEKANKITREIRSYRKDQSMLDKQVLLVKCRVIDREFCDRFLDDIILPLSNCSINSDSISPTDQSIISTNEKLDLLVGSIGSTDDDGDKSTLPVAESTAVIDSDNVIDPLLVYPRCECCFGARTITSTLSSLKIFNRSMSDEVERSDVMQWCNWLNGRRSIGKNGLKDTLEFVDRYLQDHTYCSTSRYPSLADSCMLLYLAETAGASAAAGRYRNIERWKNTVANL